MKTTLKKQVFNTEEEAIAWIDKNSTKESHFRFTAKRHDGKVLAWIVEK